MFYFQTLHWFYGDGHSGCRDHHATGNRSLPFKSELNNRIPVRVEIYKNWHLYNFKGGQYFTIQIIGLYWMSHMSKEIYFPLLCYCYALNHDLCSFVFPSLLYSKVMSSSLKCIYLLTILKKHLLILPLNMYNWLNKNWGWERGRKGSEWVCCFWLNSYYCFSSLYKLLC